VLHSRETFTNSLPDDTEFYKEIGSYRLLLSKKDGLLMIETLCYHSGRLCITKEDLDKIVEDIQIK